MPIVRGFSTPEKITSTLPAELKIRITEFLQVLKHAFDACFYSSGGVVKGEIVKNLDMINNFAGVSSAYCTILIYILVATLEPSIWV